MKTIKLSKRQEDILHIVKEGGPITGKEIADKLSLTRATLRPDLAILTMAGSLEAKPRVGYFINSATENRGPGFQFGGRLVSEFCSHPIIVQKSASVYDAIVQIFLEDVGTLYTVNKEGMLSGVVSRKDLLRAAIGNSQLQELPVSVIMTRMPNIITVKMDETLHVAAKKLITNNIDSIPVVKERDTENFEVIGRITKTTITRAFLEIID